MTENDIDTITSMVEIPLVEYRHMIFTIARMDALRDYLTKTDGGIPLRYYREIAAIMGWEILDE